MSTSEKCAETATQLQVDEYILDYLLFCAIQTQLLQNRPLSTSPARESLPLQLVDSFLVVFHYAHADYQGNIDLQYRLRLLKFVVLFTTRKSSSTSTPGVQTLKQLQLARQNNASAFRLKDDGLAGLNLPDLTKYLAPSDEPLCVNQNDIHGEATNHGSTALDPASLPPVSLLDTLPSFMALSATHNAMQDTSITDTWMRLAAGYMAQAVIEQYVDYESEGSEVLQEAFAWGFDSESMAEEGSNEWMINTMFFGEDEVIAGWDEVRDDHMRAVSLLSAHVPPSHSFPEPHVQLIPPAGGNLQNHLRTMLQGSLPRDGFEQRILSFLEGLLQSQPKPILVQIESGQLEGFSRRDIQLLQKRVGLAKGVASL